uniref:Uncharacterized protein n=1 Tax=Oryza sativa subsp. japonica TaxID=39947 RepID=Q5Z481_ORYSJ|nr:hypothetical protein [Oryza sativa Japonica Group]
MCPYSYYCHIIFVSIFVRTEEPKSSSSDDHLVIGELCVVSPCVQVDLDALKGTHLGMYEQRNVTVLVEAGESASEVVAAEAYFVHTSYAKA